MIKILSAIVATILVLAVILAATLRGCKSGNSVSQDKTDAVADLQKQVAELQHQLAEARSLRAPAPTTPPKSEVEQAIEGVVLHGGEMVFGKKSTATYLAGEVKRKELANEADLLIVNKKRQQEELEETQKIKPELELQVDDLNKKVVGMEILISSARVSTEVHSDEGPEATNARRNNIKFDELELKNLKKRLEEKTALLRKAEYEIARLTRELAN